MKFFGSSGIRGLANVEITPAVAMRLGSALATIHDGGSVVIGRDTRITGPMLEAALSSGVTSCGADARHVGVLPTPVVAWLTRELEADAGVAITASHNPPEYNGFKAFNHHGMSLTEAEQAEVEALMESGEFDYAPGDCVGSAEELDATAMYLEAVDDFVDVGRGWRVACDCFCGATTAVVTDAFDGEGLTPSIINGDPDGHFPAGTPEPTVESLGRLGSYVRQIGAEVGFGFDGDGDRMMAVDDAGTPVDGDRLLAAYAGYVCERRGGGTVVTHVGASMCVDDAVSRAGGKVVRVRVGDAYITEEIQRRMAVFGGEPIGAWILPEFQLCPDGVVSALKLLEAMEDRDQTLREFVAGVPEYPTLSAKAETRQKARVMERVLEGYSSVFGDVKEVNRVDGVRLRLDDGWVLIRASGTEPIIRLSAEGKNKKAAEDLITKGKTLIKQSEERS